jgi:hypothetical protein
LNRQRPCTAPYISDRGRRMPSDPATAVALLRRRCTSRTDLFRLLYKLLELGSSIRQRPCIQLWLAHYISDRGRRMPSDPATASGLESSAIAAHGQPTMPRRGPMMPSARDGALRAAAAAGARGLMASQQPMVFSHALAVSHRSCCATSSPSRQEVALGLEQGIIVGVAIDAAEGSLL